MLLTLVVTTLAAQAAPLPPDNDVPGSTAAAAAAEQVARAAQRLRGDATIATTLEYVNVGKPDASEQALAALGFETALDLRLLAGGPEAVELMTTLRAGGELSIADRGKIRLLVGDLEHLARVSSMPPGPHFSGSATDRDTQHEQAAPRHHRQLQAGGGNTDRSTLSADTIAIVLSVFVGVCGYLLQAWTSEKASRHAGDLQREHDQQAREMQVEQDRMQAQMRRTERWVDDCCTPFMRCLMQYTQARIRFGESLPCACVARQLSKSVAVRSVLSDQRIPRCAALQSPRLRRNSRRRSRRCSPSCTRATR
eukprot:SAG22_NODE_13_length_33548_cov_57.167773_11_plen_310_part_00